MQPVTTNLAVFFRFAKVSLTVSMDSLREASRKPQVLMTKIVSVLQIFGALHSLLLTKFLA